MRIRFARSQSMFSLLVGRKKRILFVGVLLVALIAFPLVKKINQKRALDAEIRELAARAEHMEKKNSELKEMMAYLESNGFAEKEARLNLDLKKPGETVVVVKDNEPAQASDELNTVFRVPGLEKAAKPVQISNSRRWWEYFFGVWPST